MSETEIVTIPIQDIPEAKIFIKEDSVWINQTEYKVLENYKNAIDEKALEDRYTALLQKFHYIVGDWGHEQLRLKGFYANETKSVDDEQKIFALQDYLREYCAFGCAYFVLERTDEPVPFQDNAEKTPRRRPKKRSNLQQDTAANHHKNNNNQPKKHAPTAPKVDKKVVSKDKPTKSKHNFVIRHNRGDK